MDHDARLAEAKQLHFDGETSELAPDTSGFPTDVKHWPNFYGLRHEIFAVFCVFGSRHSYLSFMRPCNEYSL
jgi:hypothetical protein